MKNYLDGKRVFLTGGTGSFGKAFARRILSDFPNTELVIYSRDELKQFEMREELGSDRIRYVIGDVRDEKRVRRVIRGCQVAVHAAAIKQVPASEDNPVECIKTNINGAENIIDAAIDAGVERVVALSTDKAANPINLYGATKLCSDKLFTAANKISGPDGTKFANVRYGNVIASRGSVIPFFKERAKTGVLPITDPEMTRFWISLDQGVDTVLMALKVTKGAEIFVPKLPSMRIVDLARAICPTCEHEIVGIRPGERLHEVMVPADEYLNTWEFKNFYVIRPQEFDAGKSEPLSYDGETGRRVEKGFEYRSDNNDEWFDADALRAFI